MASEFSNKFARTDTGVHTVEGNLAGLRAAKLTKKREEAQAAFEAKKQQMKDDMKRGSKKIDDKFSRDKNDVYEKSFKEQTVGLVSAKKFRELRENIKDLTEKTDEESKKKKKRKKKMVAALSFNMDGDEEEDSPDMPKEEPAVPKKKMKNPEVDTSFLPDRERQEAELRRKLLLKREWEAEQDRIKSEMLEVTYSYWDGSGHRRVVQVSKGTTIGKFLDLCHKDISQDFPELRGVSGDNLVYIKEDLIIPHNFSFYDLIATKARGKSGPLFHFDVHDDLRLGPVDTRIEKDESHPGKVLQRSWYERNKHIFPASRWEVWEPGKDFGTYTIHGGEIYTKEDKK
mmetsp:Transcript_17134/g.27010  ORF Transcript_17134/g.27010 Transcript_17134/m.27010 type:complete len:343 (-) Transcript_17134:508-1536(-)